LFERLSEILSDFRGRRLKDRRIHETAIQDIYTLGLGIVEESCPRDMDDMLKPDKGSISVPLGGESDEQSVDDLAHVLLMISRLSKRVTELENELKDFRDENTALKCEIADFKDKIEQLMTHRDAQTTTAESAETASNSGNDTNDAGVEVVEFNETLASNAEVRNPPKSVRRKSKNKRKKKQKKGNTGTNGNVNLATTRSMGNAPSSTPAAPADTSNEPLLRAAPSARPSIGATSSLYIGGLDASQSPQDVARHLRKLGVENAMVRILSTRGDWRSFCAEVNVQDLGPLCAPGKWPSPAYARPFKQSVDIAPRARDPLRAAPPRDDRRESSPHQWYRRRDSQYDERTGRNDRYYGRSYHPSHSYSGTRWGEY
jgi:regulator of replication initiation timing